MIGLDIAVGFLVNWAVRKARRVGQRLDTEVVDPALDAGVDRLHDLVSTKLAGDSALTRLANEAEQSGEVSPRTQQRAQLALEDAADDDPDFAAQVTALVQQLQDMQRTAGVSIAGQQGVAVSDGVRADHGSIAIGGMTGGTVSIGTPPDPSTPGRDQG